METDWLFLDRVALNPTREMMLGGVMVPASLSPFDVPTHVRAFIKSGTLHIEFQYLDEERPRPFKLDNGITVWIGKNSERLFAIAVPNVQTSGKLSLSKVVEDVLAKLPTPRHPRHTAVINESRQTTEKAVVQREALLQNMMTQASA